MLSRSRDDVFSHSTVKRRETRKGLDCFGIVHVLTIWMMVATSGLGVRRDKAALYSGCKSHPANAPAGSSRSSYGGDEIAEAFGKRVTNW